MKKICLRDIRIIPIYLKIPKIEFVYGKFSNAFDSIVNLFFWLGSYAYRKVNTLSPYSPPIRVIQLTYSLNSKHCST